MIVIVDYGLGNLRSIANMLKKSGSDSVISGDAEVINTASKLILPGVGAFDTAMNELETRGLIEVLNKKVLEQKCPVLGICLGMQLLTGGSEEGVKPGLGWIPGKARRFPKATELKVPHMRWNTVRPVQLHPLLQDIDEASRFYFVHSYYVTAESESHSLLKTDYGVSFDAGIARDNIMGVQFHPERSHKFGRLLLTNFIQL